MKTKNRSTLSAPVIGSGGKTSNNRICRRWFALGLGGFLFILIFALSPSPMQAQCKRWDVSGNWQLELDNGENVRVNLQQGEWQQQSANLTGTGERIATANAKFYFHNKNGEAIIQEGVISGNITGNSFAMLLTVRPNKHWFSGTIHPSSEHRFTGTIDPSGNMEGTRSGDRVHWISNRGGWCADSPPNKEVTNKPASQPPSSASAATISANPATVSVPAGQTSGTTTLTWDAGKDHPYAEVWVKVDDADETKVLEQGKGSRQVTVKPGKTYQYILTDAGKRLATVTVPVEGSGFAEPRDQSKKNKKKRQRDVRGGQ